jgi:hypothetical protein
VEVLTRQLLAKVLHGPTVRLREAAAVGKGEEVADAAGYLFALEAELLPAAEPCDAGSGNGIELAARARRGPRLVPGDARCPARARAQVAQVAPVAQAARPRVGRAATAGD